MESSFYRLDKDWEDKSNQKKPKGKKKWLLSRQYLQPFEEPDDMDEEPINDLSVRDKIKSICRSAFYGMKEGLLTGVFLGGVYGVLKLLNGNSSIFFASASAEDTKENEKVLRSYYGGGVPHERKSPARTRRVDTRPYFSSNRRQTCSHSGSISYEEKLLSHRIIEEALYNFSREKKPQYSIAARRARNAELSYSRLPVKTEKHSESQSPRAGDKKKYYQNTNEKIKIVSFAFVKTTGAFETELTTSKSVAHGSPKQSKSELEKKGIEEEEEDEEQESNQQKNRPSLESSKSGVPRPTSDSLRSPKKSTLSVDEIPSGSLKSKDHVTEKRQKSLKTEGSVLAANREKSLSSVRSGHANIADDSVPPGGTERKEIAAKGLEKAPSSSRSIVPKITGQQSIINEPDEPKKKLSRITIISPKNNSREPSPGRAAEQSSSLFIESLEPDQSEMSARPPKQLSQESRLRFKESNKGGRRVSKHSVRDYVIVETETDSVDTSHRTSRSLGAQKMRDSENIYPASRPPSYLVNPEDVSNGYGSPVTISSEEQESEHDTIRSKFSENSFTPDIEINRSDFEDIGFTPSNISEFQIRPPSRAFSPLMSATRTDPNRTLTAGVWNVKEYQESSTTRAEESESAAGSRLKDERHFSSRMDSQKRPVDFSDSERIESENLRSALSGAPAARPSEKLVNSSDRVSGKSQVIESFNRSLLLRERVFDNSRVISERVNDRCSEKCNARIRDKFEKSFSGDLAKSSSSLIQGASPETSRSRVKKGAPAAPQTHKANPDKEELREFGLFSSVTDNAIVVYACNCAIVLGILCTVISTTRASLKI